MRKNTAWKAGALLAGSLAIASSVARAEDWRMAASPVASQAKGTLSTDAKGPNTRLEVKVEGLIPAEEANLGNSVYIVWAQPYDQSVGPQNLGALPVDNSKHGEFKTITALRHFTLFITPEPSPQVTSPTGKELLGVLVSLRPEK